MSASRLLLLSRRTRGSGTGSAAVCGATPMPNRANLHNSAECRL